MALQCFFVVVQVLEDNFFPSSSLAHLAKVEKKKLIVASSARLHATVPSTNVPRGTGYGATRKVGASSHAVLPVSDTIQEESDVAEYHTPDGGSSGIERQALLSGTSATESEAGQGSHTMPTANILIGTPRAPPPDAGRQVQVKGYAVHRRVMRLVLVLISAVFAAYIPHFGAFLGFIGAFSNAAVIFVLPVLCYLQLFATELRTNVCHRTLLWAIFLGGMVVVLVGSAISLKGML